VEAMMIETILGILFVLFLIAKLLDFLGLLDLFGLIWEALCFVFETLVWLISAAVRALGPASNRADPGKQE
jgi:hypothetical protein